MATRSDITNKVYELLWEPSNSSNYDLLSVVVPTVNEIVKAICNKLVINPQNQQRYVAWELPFLRKKYFFEHTHKRTLTEEVSVWDVSVKMDTNWLPDEWSVMIWEDIVKYTSKTADELLWVTGIQIGQKASTIVYPLFSLPNSITKPYTIFMFEPNGQRTEVPYTDYRIPVRYNRYYTVVIDNDWAEYIMFFWYQQKDKFVMNYYVKPSNLENDSDVCVIPDEYVLRVVPPLVAWQILRDNEEAEDASTKFARWFAWLDEMYSYYNSLVEKNNQIVYSKPPDLSSIKWYGKRHRRSFR
jgi:hypothetical protein